VTNHVELIFVGFEGTW